MPVATFSIDSTALHRQSLRAIWLLYFMLLQSVFLFGQKSNAKVLEVRESYSIELTPNATMQDVERAAVEQARLKAIGQYCGFTLKEVTMNRVLDVRRQSDTGTSNEHTEDFSVYTQSSVLGVWVRDLSPPTLDWHCVQTQSGQRLEVTAQVHGEVRGLPDKGLAEVRFYACNPDSPQDSKTEFKEFDDLGAVFQCAQSGFAEIFYLSLGERRAYRLLPSQGQSEHMAPVLADTIYHCFMGGQRQVSPLWNTKRFQVTLQPQQQQMFDELVVIYSPKECTKPIFSTVDGLQYLTIEAFNDWLGNARILNEELVVKQVVLDVRR